jgi:hypothetical protein
MMKPGKVILDGYLRPATSYVSQSKIQKIKSWGYTTL